MRQLWKGMSFRLKKSICIAFDVIAGISTLVGIWGFTISRGKTGMIGVYRLES